MSKIIASPPRFQDISVLRLPAIVGISRTIDCCRDTQFLSWIAQLPHHDQTLQQSKADYDFKRKASLPVVWAVRL